MNKLHILIEIIAYNYELINFIRLKNNRSFLHFTEIHLTPGETLVPVGGGIGPRLFG